MIGDATTADTGLVRPAARPRPLAALISLGLFARRKPLGGIGLIMLALVAFGVIAGPLISPYDAYEPSYAESLKGPSASHWLGTDQQGRDLFTRVLIAGRFSFTVGLGAAAVSILGAVTIGMVSGYVGGWIDLVVQRLVDAWMSIPFLLLLLTIMAVIGPGLRNVILVVGAYGAVTQSRVVRASVLSTTHLPFVESARALGASNLRIVAFHVWPNITAAVIIIGSLAVGAAILAESSLSFLGYGVPPPDPTWGQMIGVTSRPYLIRAPWLAIAPGLALSIVVFSVNVLGDGLRDVLDPRLRGSR